MSISFPTSPYDGQTHLYGDITFKYELSTRTWSQVTDPRDLESVTTVTVASFGDYVMSADATYYILIAGNGTSSRIILPAVPVGTTYEFTNTGTTGFTRFSAPDLTSIPTYVTAGATVKITCITSGGSTASSWNAKFIGTSTITGSGSTVLSSGPVMEYGTITSPTIITPYAGTQSIVVSDTVQYSGIYATSDVAFITSSVSSGAVTIATPQAGLSRVLVNRTSIDLKIYPPVGATINSMSSSGYVILGAGSTMVFYGQSSTSWVCKADVSYTGTGDVVRAAGAYVTTPTIYSATINTSTLKSSVLGNSSSITAVGDVQGQTSLTNDLNIITASSANPAAVTLQSSTVGRWVTVLNKSPNVINVYPSPSGSIDSMSSSTPVTLQPGEGSIFYGRTSTDWSSTYTGTKTATDTAIRTAMSHIYGRNLIINGSGTVNQRGYTSGTTTNAASQYTIDRWRVVTSGQNLTFTGTAAGYVLTAPAGGVDQVVEGANIVGGTYVISWTGTATCTVGGVAQANGSTMTLTANTNYTVRMTGGTFTKLQLEQGSVATTYEQRTISQELVLCQRYFQAINASRLVGVTYVPNGDTRAAIRLITTMRTAPTITYTGGTQAIFIGFAGTLINVSLGTLQFGNRSVDSFGITSVGNYAALTGMGDVVVWGDTGSGLSIYADSEL